MNRGFKIHAIVFVLVMAFLIGIDLWTAEPYWAHWVLLGWGAGLAAHFWYGSGRSAATVAAVNAGAPLPPK